MRIQQPFSNNPRLPVTVDQAVDECLVLMDLDSINNMRVMEQSDLICLHHSLGRMIRNAFMFCVGGNELLLQDCLRVSAPVINRTTLPCEDDASMLIINKLWEHLQTTSDFATDQDHDAVTKLASLVAQRLTPSTS